MEKTVYNHIRAFEVALEKQYPKLRKRFQKLEPEGPANWEEMLDECDVLFHEQKKHALAHERLHSDEIVMIERAFEHWEDTDPYTRYAIYSFLLWLKKEDKYDQPVDKALAEFEDLVAHTLPPTSQD